jgi:hypothetical protein
MLDSLFKLIINYNKNLCKIKSIESHVKTLSQKKISYMSFHNKK